MDIYLTQHQADTISNNLGLRPIEIEYGPADIEPWANGGWGSGFPTSEEAKRNISFAMKGKLAGEKNPMYGKGHLVTGKNNPFYGLTHSPETLKLLSEQNKIRQLGEKNSFYGKSHSEELKQRMSAHRKANPTHKYVICPHCDKEGAKNAMVRWHFDNCKVKDANP